MLAVVVVSVTLLAGFVQGVAGFGFGLVAMAILPFFLPIRVAVPLMAIFGLAFNTQIIWGLRRHIRWRRTWLLLVTAAVGVPVGVASLRELDPRMLKLGLGIVIAGYATISLAGWIRPTGRTVRPWALWATLAGLACGVLGGAFAAGGPPVVVLLTLTDWSKDQVKVTLNVVFLLLSVGQTTLFGAHGMITGDMLLMNAAALPALVLGVWLGTLVYARVDQALFRRIVLALLWVVGVVYIVRG